MWEGESLSRFVFVVESIKSSSRIPNYRKSFIGILIWITSRYFSQHQPFQCVIHGMNIQRDEQPTEMIYCDLYFSMLYWINMVYTWKTNILFYSIRKRNFLNLEDSMGRVPTSRRKTSKKKSYYRSHCTANRARDVDQIQVNIF